MNSYFFVIIECRRFFVWNVEDGFLVGGKHVLPDSAVSQVILHLLPEQTGNISQHSVERIQS